MFPSNIDFMGSLNLESFQSIRSNSLELDPVSFFVDEQTNRENDVNDLFSFSFRNLGEIDL